MKNKNIGNVPQRTTVWEALSSLQGKLTPIKRTKEVKFTANGREIHFWYAPLDDIFSVLYPLCAEFGLFVRHEIIDGAVEAIVTHKYGGEVRSGRIKVNQGGDMKSLGGDITYARRYTLALVLGLVTEDDMDAAGLSERTEVLEKFAVTRIRDAIKAAKTDEELAKTANILVKDLDSVRAGKKASLGLTEQQYNELLDILAKRKAEIQKGTNSEPVNQE